MDYKDYLKQTYRDNPRLAHKKACAEMVKTARKEANLTQLELAKKMGTKQESIARVESGSMLPSIEFLYRVAMATNHKFKMPRLIK